MLKPLYYVPEMNNDSIKKRRSRAFKESSVLIFGNDEHPSVVGIWKGVVDRAELVPRVRGGVAADDVGRVLSKDDGEAELKVPVDMAGRCGQNQASKDIDGEEHTSGGTKGQSCRW
jgi:hypothetical protein